MLRLSELKEFLVFVNMWLSWCTDWALDPHSQACTSIHQIILYWRIFECPIECPHCDWLYLENWCQFLLLVLQKLSISRVLHKYQGTLPNAPLMRITIVYCQGTRATSSTLINHKCSLFPELIMVHSADFNNNVWLLFPVTQDNI